MYAFNYTDDGGQPQVAVCNSLPDESYGFGVITPIEVPSQPDKLFRKAWTIVGNDLVVDLVKAKEIAHDKRRTQRDELMKPHDDIIAKQIPGNDAVAAEAARVVIRDANATIQANIDACVDEASLRLLIETEELPT